MSAAAKPSPPPREVGREVYEAFFDPPTSERISLLRMEPAASCPEHDHSEVEECLVLEGEANIDRHEYRPGDYVVARPAPTQSSPLLAGRPWSIGRRRASRARAWLPERWPLSIGLTRALGSPQ